jgi:hypothetical protein
VGIARVDAVAARPSEDQIPARSFANQIAATGPNNAVAPRSSVEVVLEAPAGEDVVARSSSQDAPAATGCDYDIVSRCTVRPDLIGKLRTGGRDDPVVARGPIRDQNTADKPGSRNADVKILIAGAAGVEIDPGSRAFSSPVKLVGTRSADEAGKGFISRVLVLDFDFGRPLCLRRRARRERTAGENTLTKSNSPRANTLIVSVLSTVGTPPRQGLGRPSITTISSPRLPISASASLSARTVNRFSGGPL